VDCVFDGVEEGGEGAEAGVEGVRAAPGGSLHKRLPPDEADRWIDAVRKAGGSVQSVVPAQRTLEHVLLDEVERARPVNAKRLGVLA
jgi:hypothetical protein